MAIIGKLMGARPSMSAPRAAPKPAPVSSRPSLDFLTGGQPKQTIPADALDRDALIQDILSKIQVPSAPVFDPTGLQARLAELEGRKAPVFDPSALEKQIAELQNREAPVFDPSELQKQISDLRQRPGRDDFMSIERQLQDLRNRDIPQFDPSALQDQIGGLQQQLGNIPQFDDSALRDRLQALEGREIPQFDASGLQSQIGGLEDRLANIPQFDPSQLKAGIAGLQDRLANIPQFDPSALQQQIEANRNLLGNLPQFDDSALRERLKSLEGREIPQFDPSALQNRLAQLEGRQAPTFNPEDFRDQFLSIAREGIEIPKAPTIDREELVRDITGRIKQPRPFDPTRLRERLAALENREPAPVAPAFDPSGLRARLDALEGREPVAAPPAFDPSSLQERLAALENRQPVAPPAFDTSSIDQRFEDIARQLAELQSAQAQPSPDPVVPPVQPLPVEPVAPPETPLPIQPPGDLDLGIKQDRPDIRDFAKPLPGGGTIFDQLQPPVTSIPLVGGITPPSISPEEQARRDEQKNLSSQISSATNDFYAAFPDAPKPPRFVTNEVSIFTNPFTGETQQGSGMTGRYLNQLKAYLDANPAAQASYNENVVTPQKRLIDLRGGPAQGPVLAPIGGPAIKPGVGQPIVPGTSPFTPKGLTGEELLKLPDEELKKYIPTEQLATVGFAPPAYYTPSPEEFRKSLQANIEYEAGLKPGDKGFGGRRYSLVDDKTRPGGGRPTPPISIGGPGGGVTDTLARPIPGQIPVLRDDLVFAGGSPTFNERGETFVPPTPDPVVDPTPDPVATPTGDPAAPPPAPTIPTPPGSVDPVIMGQTADEVVTDPLIRALYFGTPDQPGFFNQLQQVGANLLGAQAPGTEYDPSMTEKFFNPFEDQVVQQTVEDVLKAGEQRDIAARAQDIGRGGLSAFGSRARLTASERQEDLGRGLGKALAGIRQSGFSEAQRAGLSEFDRQYGRDISQLYRPLNILQGIGGLLPGYTQATSKIGTTYGMPQDPSALGLGAALSAYSSLAPQTGAAYNAYANTTGQG